MSTWYFCEERQRFAFVHQIILVQKEPLEVTLYEDVGVMGSKWIAEREISEHLTQLSPETCGQLIRGALREEIQWDISEEESVPYRWDLTLPQRVFRVEGTLHLHPARIRVVDKIHLPGDLSLWWDGQQVHAVPGIDLLAVIVAAAQHPSWQLIDHTGDHWLLHRELIHHRTPHYVPSQDVQQTLQAAVGQFLLHHCFHLV
jgi:hypothetical protein